MCSPASQSDRPSLLSQDKHSKRKAVMKASVKSDISKWHQEGVDSTEHTHIHTYIGCVVQTRLKQ